MRAISYTRKRIVEELIGSLRLGGGDWYNAEREVRKGHRKY